MTRETQLGRGSFRPSAGKEFGEEERKGVFVRGAWIEEIELEGTIPLTTARTDSRREGRDDDDR